MRPHVHVCAHTRALMNTHRHTTHSFLHDPSLHREGFPLIFLDLHHQPVSSGSVLFSTAEINGLEKKQQRERERVYLVVGSG